MNKSVITLFLLCFVLKINAQQAKITVEFLKELTKNFNLSEMQSKMQNKNFDFIERQEIYVDNYTYLYGDSYDAEKETAFSFIKITVEKESDKLTKISLDGDESAFLRLQTYIKKTGKKGKSFFENDNVKTVYTIENVHYIFENITRNGKNEKKITLIPTSSNLNYFDGLIINKYKCGNNDNCILTTKFSDFKYVYKEEKWENNFSYSLTSLDKKNKYHLDYECVGNDIRITLIDDGKYKFTYKNNKKVIVSGKYSSKILSTMPNLGALTTNKTITNFVNSRKLAVIIVNKGELLQLDVYNTNGELQQKLKFKNRRLIE